jgi:hypothetical protein
MNSVHSPARMRITIDRYQKMVVTGVLTRDDHVELIEGEILHTAPISPQHASVTARFCKRLILALGDTAMIGVGSAVDLGHFSEPQPDLLLLKPRPDDYSSAHPQVQDVLLTYRTVHWRSTVGRSGICTRNLASPSTGS